MKYINPKVIKLLNALPLDEVMRNNGYFYVRKTKSEYYYRCPLPGHEDHDASFVVSAMPVAEDGEEEAVAAFHCLGCRKIGGHGAISLQSQLLGLGSSPQGDDFLRVCHKLLHDFDVKAEGMNKDVRLFDFSYVDAVSELQYELCHWTEQHLRALGCMKSHKPIRGSEDPMDASISGWAMKGDIDEEEQHPVPFPASEISRIFHCYPVKAYTLPAGPNSRKDEEGRPMSVRIACGEDYPVFVFQFFEKDKPWRVKKYEPYGRPSREGRTIKWSWWYQGGKNLGGMFSNDLYGDCDVIDALYNEDIVPTDSSPNHNHPVVSVYIKNPDGTQREKKIFRRVVLCSGPRDAMQVYFHSDAHVVYTHSETSKINPRTIRRLFAIAQQVCVLYDMDETGRRESLRLNLDYLLLCNVTLPEGLSSFKSRRSGKPCKDVSDFFEHYGSEALRRGRTLNQLFHAMLRDAKPLQFWKCHAKRNAVQYEDGSHSRYVYELNPDNMSRFLAASGMALYKGSNTKELPRIVLVRDNLVRFLRDDEIVKTAKQLMKQWLTDHPYYNEEELRNAIIRSTQILSRSTLLDELPEIHLDPKFWGPTWDYIFFRNGALRVTATERTMVPYEHLDFLVNEEAILPYDYVEQDNFFRIDRNPMLEEYERQHQERLDDIPKGDVRSMVSEEERWNEERTLWQFRLTLSKPMNEMPAAFQFLYDTGRMFWRKEHEAKREGRPRSRWLEAGEQQFQDMQFVSKAAALGYVLSRYKQPSMGRIAYLVEHSVENEQKSSGGTGKSIIGHLLQVVRPQFKIPGKNWKSNTEMAARNFVGYDYLLHGYIHIEDLRRGVSCEELYCVANSDFNRKQLNKDEETLSGDLTAKVILSSNALFDLTEPSTSRRLWPILVSDYYHEGNHSDLVKYDPSEKFGFHFPSKGFSEDMPQDERDALVHVLVECLQFYLSQRRYIEAPIGAEGQHRRLNSSREFRNEPHFVEWADRLFRGGYFFGVAIPKRDLIVSYFQFTGRSTMKAEVMRYSQSPIFDRLVGAYCTAMGITANPSCVLNEAGKARYECYHYEWDAEGRLMTERPMGRSVCYVFYRRGEEPKEGEVTAAGMRHVTDPGCEGYVGEG